MTLTFGIYPGGRLGLGEPGPAEDPARIEAALTALHGDHPFLVRGYVHYADAGAGLPAAPPDPEQYATGTRRLDLVACFREPGTDLTGWLAFLRDQLRAHGPRLASLQITEEPNHAGPGGDGGAPAVRDALIRGVIEAKREVRRLGLDVRIGCNSTLDFDPAQEFWTDLGRRGGDEFRSALDYVGLDFFPDVFRPIPASQLAGIVTGSLIGFRESSLAAAGLPATLPLHITEHGWGTGPGRSAERQVEVLELVVGIVAELAERLCIEVYEYHALRDADSGAAEPVLQLGLLRDDYTPKPAFEAYRRLIAAQPAAAVPGAPGGR